MSIKYTDKIWPRLLLWGLLLYLPGLFATAAQAQLTVPEVCAALDVAADQCELITAVRSTPTVVPNNRDDVPPANGAAEPWIVTQSNAISGSSSLRSADLLGRHDIGSCLILDVSLLPGATIRYRFALRTDSTDIFRAFTNETRFLDLRNTATSAISRDFRPLHTDIDSLSWCYVKSPSGEADLDALFLDNLELISLRPAPALTVPEVCDALEMVADQCALITAVRSTPTVVPLNGSGSTPLYGAPPVPWSVTLDNTLSGGSSLRNADLIGFDHVASCLILDVSLPPDTTIRYRYSLDSEDVRDVLRVYANETQEISFIRLNTAATNAEHTLAFAVNRLSWCYIKDGSREAGLDAAFLDNLELIPPFDGTIDSVQEVCDVLEMDPSQCALITAVSSTPTVLPLNSSGNPPPNGASVPWTVTVDNAISGGSSLRSGDLFDQDDIGSCLILDVSLPPGSTIRFRARLSAENRFDIARVLANETETLATITLSTVFAGIVLEFTPAFAIDRLSWCYVKDLSEERQLDTFILDNLELIDPTIGTLCSVLDAEAEFCDRIISVASAPQSAQWQSTMTAAVIGSNSLVSPIIEAGASSCLQVVRGIFDQSRVLGFYWRITGGTAADSLQFSGAGLSLSIAGEVADWTFAEIRITPQAQITTLSWCFRNDSGTAARAWLDGLSGDNFYSRAEICEVLDMSERDCSLLTGGVSLELIPQISVAGAANNILPATPLWYETTATAIAGGSSLRSGAITDNQGACLTLNLTLPANSSIIVYHRSDSEPIGNGLVDPSRPTDFLRLTANDNLILEDVFALPKGTQSLRDWERRSFTPSAAVERLTWCYRKDTSSSFGEDAAWIDSLSFETGDIPIICRALDLDTEFCNTAVDAIRYEPRTSPWQSSISDPQRGATSLASPQLLPGQGACVELQMRWPAGHDLAFQALLDFGGADASLMFTAGIQSSRFDSTGSSWRNLYIALDSTVSTTENYRWCLDHRAQSPAAAVGIQIDNLIAVGPGDGYTVQIDIAQSTVHSSLPHAFVQRIIVTASSRVLLPAPTGWQLRVSVVGDRFGGDGDGSYPLLFVAQSSATATAVIDLQLIPVAPAQPLQLSVTLDEHPSLRRSVVPVATATLTVPPALDTPSGRAQIYCFVLDMSAADCAAVQSVTRDSDSLWTLVQDEGFAGGNSLRTQQLPTAADSCLRLSAAFSSQPQRLEFYWRYDTPLAGTAEFYIDNELQVAASGLLADGNDWHLQQLFFDSDTAVDLAWCLSPAAVNSGVQNIQDRLWLDSLSFYSGEQAVLLADNQQLCQILELPSQQCTLIRSFSQSLHEITAAGSAVASSAVVSWSAVTTPSLSGGSSLASPPLVHGHRSCIALEMELQNSLLLSFYWRSDSEQDRDVLSLAIDGSPVGSISGRRDWRRQQYLVPRTATSLSWCYQKSAAVSTGLDRVWLDSLSFARFFTTVTVAIAAVSTPRRSVLGGDFLFRTTVVSQPGSEAMQDGLLLTVADSSGDRPVSTYALTFSGNTASAMVSRPENRAGAVILGLDSEFLTAEGLAAISVQRHFDFGEPQIRSQLCSVLDVSSADCAAIRTVSAALPSGASLQLIQPWRISTDSGFVGASSLQSGAIGDGQLSCLSLTLQLAPFSQLRYSWQVSSEEDFDFLEFFVDGEYQGQGISGMQSWQQQHYSIGAVSTVAVSWCYSKDREEFEGLDRGWLDGLELISINELLEPEFTAISTPLVVALNGRYRLQVTVSIDSDVGALPQLDIILQTAASTNVVASASSYTLSFIDFQALATVEVTLIDPTQAGQLALVLAGSSQIGVDTIPTAAVSVAAFGFAAQRRLLCAALDLSSSDCAAVNSISAADGSPSLWFLDSDTRFAGDSSLRSPPTEHNQSNCLELGVELPLPFGVEYYQQTDTAGGDEIQYQVNGNRVTGETGRLSESRWSRQHRIGLTDTATALSWCYTKNGDTVAGSDRVWLDRVVFTTGTAVDYIRNKNELCLAWNLTAADCATILSFSFSPPSSPWIVSNEFRLHDHYVQSGLPPRGLSSCLSLELAPVRNAFFNFSLAYKGDRGHFNNLGTTVNRGANSADQIFDFARFGRQSLRFGTFNNFNLQAADFTHIEWCYTRLDLGNDIAVIEDFRIGLQNPQLLPAIIAVVSTARTVLGSPYRFEVTVRSPAGGEYYRQDLQLRISDSGSAVPFLLLPVVFSSPTSTLEQSALVTVSWPETGAAAVRFALEGAPLAAAEIPQRVVQLDSLQEPQLLAHFCAVLDVSSRDCALLRSVSSLPPQGSSGRFLATWSATAEVDNTRAAALQSAAATETGQRSCQSVEMVLPASSTVQFFWLLNAPTTEAVLEFYIDDLLIEGGLGDADTPQLYSATVDSPANSLSWCYYRIGTSAPPVVPAVLDELSFILPLTLQVGSVDATAVAGSLTRYQLVVELLSPDVAMPEGLFLEVTPLVNVAAGIDVPPLSFTAGAAPTTVVITLLRQGFGGQVRLAVVGGGYLTEVVDSIRSFSIAEALLRVVLTATDGAARRLGAGAGSETFTIRLFAEGSRNNALAGIELDVAARLTAGSLRSVLPNEQLPQRVVTDAAGIATATVVVSLAAGDGSAELAVTVTGLPDTVEISTAAIVVDRNVRLAGLTLDAVSDNLVQENPGDFVPTEIVVRAVGSDGLPFVPADGELSLSARTMPAVSSLVLTPPTLIFDSSGLATATLTVVPQPGFDTTITITVQGAAGFVLHNTLTLPVVAVEVLRELRLQAPAEVVQTAVDTPVVFSVEIRATGTKGNSIDPEVPVSLQVDASTGVRVYSTPTFTFSGGMATLSITALPSTGTDGLLRLMPAGQGDGVQFNSQSVVLRAIPLLNDVVLLGTGTATVRSSDQQVMLDYRVQLEYIGVNRPADNMVRVAVSLADPAAVTVSAPIVFALTGDSGMFSIPVALAGALSTTGTIELRLPTGDTFRFSDRLSVDFADELAALNIAVPAVAVQSAVGAALTVVATVTAIGLDGQSFAVAQALRLVIISSDNVTSVQTDSDPLLFINGRATVNIQSIQLSEQGRNGSLTLAVRGAADTVESSSQTVLLRAVETLVSLTIAVEGSATRQVTQPDQPVTVTVTVTAVGSMQNPYLQAGLSLITESVGGVFLNLTPADGSSTPLLFDENGRATVRLEVTLGFASSGTTLEFSLDGVPDGVAVTVVGAAVAGVELRRDIAVRELRISAADQVLIQAAAGQTVMTALSVRALASDGLPTVPGGLQLAAAVGPAAAAVQFAPQLLQFDANGVATATVTIQPTPGIDITVTVSVAAAGDEIFTVRELQLQIMAVEILQQLRIFTPSVNIAQRMRSLPVELIVQVEAVGNRGNPSQPPGLVLLIPQLATGVNVSFDPQLSFDSNGQAVTAVQVLPVPGSDALLEFDITGAPADVQVTTLSVRISALPLLSTLRVTAERNRYTVGSNQEVLEIGLQLQLLYIGMNRLAVTSLTLTAFSVDNSLPVAVLELAFTDTDKLNTTLNFSIGDISGEVSSATIDFFAVFDKNPLPAVAEPVFVELVPELASVTIITTATVVQSETGQSVMIMPTILADGSDGAVFNPPNLLLEVIAVTNATVDTSTYRLFFSAGRARFADGEPAFTVNLIRQGFDGRIELRVIGLPQNVSPKVSIVTIQAVEILGRVTLTVDSFPVRVPNRFDLPESFTVRAVTAGTKGSPFPTAALSLVMRLVEGNLQSWSPTESTPRRFVTAADGEYVDTVSAVLGTGNVNGVLQISVTGQDDSVQVVEATIELVRDASLTELRLEVNPATRTEQSRGQLLQSTVTVTAIGSDGLPIPLASTLVLTLTAAALPAVVVSEFLPGALLTIPTGRSSALAFIQLMATEGRDSVVSISLAGVTTGVSFQSVELNLVATEFLRDLLLSGSTGVVQSAPNSSVTFRITVAAQGTKNNPFAMVPGDVVLQSRSLNGARVSHRTVLAVSQFGLDTFTVEVRPLPGASDEIIFTLFSPSGQLDSVTTFPWTVPVRAFPVLDELRLDAVAATVSAGARSRQVQVNVLLELIYLGSSRFSAPAVMVAAIPADQSVAVTPPQQVRFVNGQTTAAVSFGVTLVRVAATTIRFTVSGAPSSATITADTVRVVLVPELARLQLFAPGIIDQSAPGAIGIDTVYRVCHGC